MIPCRSFRYNQGMERDNTAWITDLQAEGQQQASALTDLRNLLMKILPAALSRWLPPSNPHFSAFLEDLAQETLVRVLEKLDTFEKRSKFTTWVYTIAVRIGLSKLRLRKWGERSLEALEEGPDPDSGPLRKFSGSRPDPETSLAQQNAVKSVTQAIREELTPYQQQVMHAVVFQGIPMDVVAERLGTNRNALYKVMHDGRVKLKQALERMGTPAEALLAQFDD
jgi:RNA polymerase sigma-70 factor, ECF subfamily